MSSEKSTSTPLGKMWGFLRSGVRGTACWLQKQGLQGISPGSTVRADKQAQEITAQTLYADSSMGTEIGT